jgi:nicotinate-nucleotide adenylyltransferase
MNIGLFFGSFNPVHNGHLIIANHILNETLIGKIWFVVSPLNPFKIDSYLLGESERLTLIDKAIEGDVRLMTSDIEFHLSRPSFTINTLSFIKEKYTDNEFSIIMGSDNFHNLNKWKEYESIIKNFRILIYKRTDLKIENQINANIEILNAPLLDISSTEIRDIIKKGKSIRYLVPETVREEIERNGYYKK